MRCGEVKCGTYNNGELSLPGVLTTSDARLGMFLQKMRETIMANRRLLFVDGRVIVCNHNWMRDHVHTIVRLELEADVEYLVVEGAWQYYRMTGDDKWLASVLPSLEKGIDYQTSDPKRWNAKYGLCVRPYTIDTWDFTFDPASRVNRRVRGPMCAMHGDNTGVYQAMNQLAWFNDRLGNKSKSAASPSVFRALSSDGAPRSRSLTSRPPTRL